MSSPILPFRCFFHFLACRRAILLAVLLSLAPATWSAAADEELAPEAASGFTEIQTAQTHRTLAVTANPHATRAAAAILARGGSAVDAAIAAQLVLGLTEPQSSGIGGGAFMLHWDAGQRQLLAYDGRETAPAAVDESLFLTDDGRPMGFFDAVIGGRSVGVPGVVKMLAQAHQQYGKLPWAELFQPAIDLAEQGFAISPRLHLLLEKMPKVAVNPAIRAYFYEAGGSPKAVGSRLRNPEYARSLRLLAQQGESVFYEGTLARDIVAAVHSDPHQTGALSLADLAAYRARVREPVCGNYRRYAVCGAPPPSSGGTTVLAILGMLAQTDLAQADGADRAHFFAEASRLAFADRNTYVADPQFVPVPTEGLIHPAYLARRAKLIDPERAMTAVVAGHPPGAESRLQAHSPELPSTSHLSIIDAEGNAVSMTTSIETAFGSRIFVGGFLLNNQLTDFSFVPRNAEGDLIANRVQPGKRPRSSMAPTMVFEDGRLRWLIGSPGGSRIIDYVARSLWDVLDHRLTLAEAVAAPHVVQLGGATVELETDRGQEPLASMLRQRGHKVVLRPQTSGLHAIQVESNRLQGAADPRREGSAAGQ